MRLKRLNIQALPGIEPGFAFEPPAAGVNIVTGPNAIGKSSLARALGYLLRDAQKSDPPALSLE
ncbi:MAG: AAA family ATPase, partial [Gammaproteobacteria bacterium]|nr:AAA family ATPase [Gammaproteobacteria bacterium]